MVKYRRICFLSDGPDARLKTVRNQNFTRHCFLYAVLLSVVTLLLFRAPALAQTGKTILVLYGNTAELPWVKIFDASLRSTIKARSSKEVRFFSEYFDVARFPQAKHHEAFIDLIRARYADRKIDSIILGGTTAFDFLMSHRGAVFPDVPILFSFLPPDKLASLPLPANVFGVRVDFSPIPTIERPPN